MPRVAKRVWAWLAGALVVTPALCGGPDLLWALVVAGPAALSVVALFGFFGYRLSALAVAVSLAVDVAYGGPQAPVALWLLVEVPALLLLAYRAARRAPLWLAPLVGLAIVFAPVRFTARQDHARLNASVAVAAMAFLLFVCAAAIGLYLRTLEHRRTEAILRARRAQRLEVARDLHDSVAHEVTGIVLEAQAAQLDADAPAEARELLARIERAGLRALDSMDRTVHALREPDGPSRGVADLPEVVARFGPIATLNVDAGPLPGAVDTAVYHVVVEALTNVRRHASDATRVDVSVLVGDPVKVVVSSDGGRRAAGRVGRRGGTGLLGLAERLAALGGTLDAGPTPEGWRVVATLPLR